MDDTVKLARELARIARENELAEIEYRSNGHRIRLVLEPPAPPATWGMAVPMGVSQPGQPSTPVSPPSAAPPRGQTINSPLAGVFYRAPRPGAPSFVDVGQQVLSGQTLCIIEAMKLMNEIGAEVPCVIVTVLAENGQVVESGQPLFEIAPLS